MTLRLIMNPTSRSGKGRRRWKKWLQALQKSNVRFNIAITTGPGDAARIAATAQPGDTLVAVGGDGTISEVIDGMIRSGTPDLKLGILYAGTSPDFCRFHTIPVEPIAAMQTLLHGKIRAVDALQITYSQPDGSTTTAVFGCSANIGLGAAVADFANRYRRFLGDRIGTGFGVIRAILKSAPTDLTLEIDGVIEELAHVNHLVVLKNPYIASGLKLNVDLHPSDGHLVIAAIHGVNRRELIRLLPGFYSGVATESPSVLIRPCKHIRIRAPFPLPVEFDGDARGFLPAEIHILPQALQLIGNAHD